MPNILLLEDDKSLGYVLSEYIKIKGFKMEWAETVEMAEEFVSQQHFDIAILDVNLKFSTGFDFAETLSTEYPNLPFIFLTARDLKVDQLKGYQLGAEEFITKPIDEEILIAKISAILARKKKAPSAGQIINWQEIQLNSHNRELQIKGATYNLTEKESLLLGSLMTTPGELVLRKKLLEKIWESQDEFSRNSMDVYISRLRKYLAKSNIAIRNVHGKGFILE